MSVINSIRSQLSPIHPQGYPFVGGFALVGVVLFWLWPPLGWLAAMATLWCVYFFRDPQRVTPAREGIVVAPADGRISRIASAVPPPELNFGARAAPSYFDFHECIRLPHESQPGRRPRRTHGLSRRRLHQRRSRQGEREQ